MGAVFGWRLIDTVRELACLDRWLVAGHIQAAEGSDHCGSRVEVVVVAVELVVVEVEAAQYRGANDALRVPESQCC